MSDEQLDLTTLTDDELVTQMHDDLYDGLAVTGAERMGTIVIGTVKGEEFGNAIGADAYCRDAAVASETAQALVLARRTAAAS